MSSPDVLSSLLSSLPPRPPTPPREVRHEAVAASVRTSLSSMDSGLSLHTPPGFQSPASSIPTHSTSRRIQKKVGFLAQAEYKDPPVYVDGEAVRQNPTPVSLPRSASKPVKSILKVTNQVPNPLDSAAGNDFDPSNPEVKLAAMLESTLQQLAGGDRDSKVDAYLMLTRAWKASNNLPDRVALQQKMTLFTQFMQRDLVAKTPEGNLDTSLVNHVLNLLNTFLHFHGIASTISNDFGVFIIDYCIRSFEDSTTPKDTARRLMQVISLQSFSPKVMNSDRVGRLVSSLHNIEGHLKGKSIVLSRVLTYRKLVQQTRQLMIVHSNWLLDMFTDMLSNLREIRSAAISLGFEAAFSIGHEKQLSRKVMEVLSLAYEERRYIQYYEERLKAMTKDKHESAAVPEIWSVVILLLRIRLDKWEYTGPWLQIIQNCFNSGDFPTKIAANHAWARLVYLMHLEERALPKNLGTLTTPLISQLRRKGSGKTSEELRQAVLGGTCNLFYYAFKPGTNSTLLDTYWDVSVRPVLSKLLDQTAEPAEDNLKQASAILTGLFDCMTPRRWRVDHIVESPLVKPEELPAIDSKWVRRNTSRVFTVVQPILEREFLAMARVDSTTYTLWKTLVSTVSSAAAKEIKVSKDTAVFVAEALNVLQQIWKRGLLSTQEAGRNADEFLVAVRVYLEVMISSLGLLPFTEKAGKHQGPAKAPLYTLFSVLSALPPGIPDDREFEGFFKAVFAPFFTSKGDKAKLDLAQDLLSVIPMDAPRPYGAWVLAAENIMSWLESGHDSHHSAGSAGETPVGHDYRDVVKVLERAIRSTPNLPLRHWLSLFYAACERVREETGDAGVAIVVIEPLTKVMIEQFAAPRAGDNQLSSVKYMTELLSAATQPRDRQAVDAARKRLWGTVLAGSRSSTFDTFDNLYKAASDILCFSYHHLDAVGTDNAVRLLEELGGFFDRGNQRLFLRALNALHDGFCPWFQDHERLLGSQTSSVFAATKSLWDKLSHLIAALERPEQQLQPLDRFFCASFASCHRSIVNSSISLWNRLFQNIKHLDYPEGLKVALVQMQLHTDIVLPGLETSSVECAGQQPSFIDSFGDLSLPRFPPTQSSSRRVSPRAIPSQSRSPDVQRKPGVTSQRGTPRRLRHDDSQVRFAAIAPSSPGNQAESQVLTERQKEVRERQRQNAALFPEIRSSPGVKLKESDRQILPVGPQTRHAATPEPEGSFEDLVSSTPTPRRGQPMVMLEQDMTDPPSSPPEPRGNRLAEEIRSRSASHSLVEDWQFSSSPAGSPNPNRHGFVPDPSSQRGYVSVVSLPEVEKADQLPSGPANSSDKAEPHSPTVEIIEDSMVLEPTEAALVLEPCGTRVEESPSTPRHSSRLSQAQAQETPSPKSDGEIFVDAPSSPPPPTPKRSEKATKAAEGSEVKQIPTTPAGNVSFDLSEADENSLLRLVVELDSVKADHSEYHRPSPSVSPDGKGRESPIIDCIVVGDSPTKPKVSAPSRRTRSSSAASLSAEAENTSSSQPKHRVGRQKRKRASSKAPETSPKRLRQDSVSSGGEVPDSQTAPAPGPCVEVHGSGEVPAVIPEVPMKEQIHEERIPSSSAEPSLRTGSDSQDFAVPEGGDGIEGEGESQGVQSQIALEFSQSQRQEDGSTATSAAGSPESVSVGEPMQVGVQQPITEPIIEDRGEEDKSGISAESVKNTADAATTPEQSQVQKIMDLFRSGLDELRSARLSRQEVYQIEDMFMDMKRELYEAERRGRT
ncbi:Rap1-interacting factor 1 N terminal-domain-containing protein [Achaetomium macrosporum]|uniref:Rap1-interacting factor 1 N terminal-domain-containing protein n=1 Tax=Achaetomium macrosporum TaxID=79813 RepID=A0AAN7H716_9PEZI|nr:Rap1-interacting factor 1 N terminal-domain-containing protein [Achaetomium macrosporum]